METSWSAERGPARPRKALAVLYFNNLSGSRKDEYFRDGVTDDIIIELSRIRGISVASSSAVRRYPDRSLPPVEIGRRLNVAYVLDGSFHRAKNHLRLSVELVETRTGLALWAERFDREVKDVFAIQKEIAETIARTLSVIISDEEKRAIRKVPTTKVEAYDHYLRGRQHFRRFRRRSIEVAGEEFRKAIEIDPDYAGAYAGLADCCSYLCMFWSSSDETIAEADRASRKAVELDGELAEAHVARGVAISLRRDHAGAELEFREAMRLNPSLFEAYYFFARGYYAQGKLDRAVYWFRRACQARPEDYQAPTLLGSALKGMGLVAESNEAYRSTVELAQRHLEVDPGDTRALYFSAIAYCQLGERRDLALEWADRALAIDPEEPQVLYNVACVYALQGLFEKAIDCLTKTLAHGELWLEWMRNDPDLEALHDHPRYRALAAESEPSN